MKDLTFASKTLILIFILALVVRFVPVVVAGVPVGLDSYLHIDIALRIIENGGILSTDPLSLIGMKAYSYPPGFHAILALFLTFLPPVMGAHFVGALIGALTCIFIFRITQDIFEDERVSLFSALFFATSPIHIFRTAMPIPEGFGVLLFTISLMLLVRYLKTKDSKQLALSLATLVVYAFSHRGWTLYVLSVFILLLVYNIDKFKRKRYMAGMVAFIAAIYYAATNYFSDLVARINVEAVTALGYLKWMGGAQLLFAAIGVVLLHKTKDKLRLFIVVWAVLLLGIGSFSFRFRDPYGAIPISMLAGYAVVNYLIPKLKKKKDHLKAAVAFIALFAVVQAFATALFVVEYPTPGEIEALTWIKDNTPEDSIVLTWKEEGYYIMGVTERKDILTWKKIYQGFFEEPPSVDEAKGAYIDMFVMFRSANKDWMLKLLNGYGVDYVYIDARMRSELDALRYGIVDHLSYDTYFEPVFANDMAEIYRFEPDPMLPENHTGKLTEYVDFGEYEPTFDNAMVMSLIPYLEGYWNGISYLDHRDYRTHYPDITEISKVLLEMHGRTGNDAYLSRAEWLLEWLDFEQLHDGGYFDQKYENPKKSTATTCLVVSDLIEMNEKYTDADMPDTGLSASMINSNFNGKWVRTLESSLFDDYRTDAVCLPALYMTGSVEAIDVIVKKLIAVRKEDGAIPYGEFSDRSTVNSQATILSSLIEYHEVSGDDSVNTVIVSGAKWLSTQQNAEGMFWNYVTPETGRVIKTEQVTYPKAVAIYDFAGMYDQKQLTLDYLKEHYDPSKDDLEALVQIMSDNL